MAQTTPTPNTSQLRDLLTKIVGAYDGLVDAELAGKPDVHEKARDHLSELVDQAARTLGMRRRRSSADPAR